MLINLKIKKGIHVISWSWPYLFYLKKILSSCIIILQKINTNSKGKFIVLIVILNLKIIKKYYFQYYLISQGNNEDLF